MKGKITLLLLLCPLLTFTRAQEHKFILAARQSFSPVIDLRLNSSFRMSSGPYAFYANAINMVIRQDYSNPSRYIISLNPALWGVEAGLVCLFDDIEEIEWQNFIPLTLIAADWLLNMKADIYWLHVGWNLDFFIYDKKFLALPDYTIGLKYEFKNLGIGLFLKGGNPDQEGQIFMPPWERGSALAALNLSYNIDYKIDNNFLSFLLLRGLK